MLILAGLHCLHTENVYNKILREVDASILLYVIAHNQRMWLFQLAHLNA